MSVGGCEKTKHCCVVLKGVVFVFALVAEDSLAERSKAVAQGAIPKGRGLEPHSCHLQCVGAHVAHTQHWRRRRRKSKRSQQVTLEHELRNIGARVGSCSMDKKGLRDRNSPICTLSQNGYGICVRTQTGQEFAGLLGRGEGESQRSDGKENLGRDPHQPGIEPGPHRRQPCIQPLFPFVLGGVAG